MSVAAPPEAYPLVDSHLHLDALNDPEAAAKAIAEGDAAADGVLLPGVTPEQTRSALARWGDAPWLRVAAARHPWYLPCVDGAPVGPKDPAAGSSCGCLEALVAEGRVDAIGETGLDRVRHQSAEAREAARAWCAWHLELAADAGLPLVLHCVRAHHALLPMLEAHGDRLSGVAHAFSGSVEEAARYARAGFRVGIGTMVLHPGAKRVRRAAAEVPLASMLLETDAPFIGPPERGGGGGRPEDLLRVCEEVARLRGETPAAVAAATAENYAELFPLRRSMGPA